MTVSRSSQSEVDVKREILVLENRLREGEHRIAVAQMAGNDIKAWEDFWLDLLHRYEALCEQAQNDSSHDRLAA